MSKKILNDLINKINIPKYNLFCPKTNLWIGMTKQEEKEHLDKFREVYSINKEIEKKEQQIVDINNDIIYTRCKK
jgi:hypothetical protein